MAMTKGTRRSTMPTTLAVNGIKHSQKLKKFVDIGYEVVADNGYASILAYYPYANNYVKIVTIENGEKKNGVMLTPKQLHALSERVSTKKEQRRV